MPRISTKARGIGCMVVATLLAGCSSSSSSHDMSAMAGTASSALGGKTRTYFIAADSVDWDYAPGDKNLITGEPLGEAEATWTKPGDDRIGHNYKKSQFRAYTDETFATLKPVDPKWTHLGILGPALEAEVGDTIKVTFKNNTPFPASMHPHGVLYNKANEGAGYADGTTEADKADDSVATGATYEYTWPVPERAAPGPMESSSTMWMYHSHVDEAADVYAGLMGPIIVTRKGKAKTDGSPKDVDRQFVVNYEVMNENGSLWIDKNKESLTKQPAADDEEFEESNLMHGVNGYVYGNLPGVTMKVGERVRWYVMGMGTEVDLHTPHWHGGVVTANGMKTDVVSVFPATMITADMRPDNVGSWYFHCHVNDHLTAGMAALYTVTK
jgi:manganese oxidase